MDNKTDGLNHFNNDEFSLKEFILKFKEWLIIINSKKKIIFISIILGAFTGLVIAFFVKPTYKSILTFAMEEDKGSGGLGLNGAIGLANSFGIDLGNNGGGAFASTNLGELMKSRLIIEKVLLEPIMIDGRVISLADYYIDFNNLRSKWLKNPNLKNLNFLPNSDRIKFSFYQDSILQVIHKKLIDVDNLNIFQKDKKITILTIEVRSENEIFSQFFCKNLAKETSDFYIETKTKKAKTNVNVLQKQVDSIRLELNNAISGVASEVDNVYNLNPALNIKGASSKKKQIDVQANTAILTNLAVQLELAKITLRKETPLIQLIDTPILPLEKEKLGKIKSAFLGGFVSGLLTIIYLIFIQIYKKIIS